MSKVFEVGGRYAGFYAAWHLKKLRRGVAEVTVAPRAHLTNPAFEPEVSGRPVRAGAVIRKLPRGRAPRQYEHHNLGVVATLGLGLGRAFGSLQSVQHPRDAFVRGGVPRVHR